MAKIGIYIKNTLETFYYTEPGGKWRVLVNPYTESLLEAALAIESEIKVSGISEMLKADLIQKWPDFGKEEELSQGGELRLVLGRNGADSFRLLESEQKLNYLYEPELSDLSLTKVRLSDIVMQSWKVTENPTNIRDRVNKKLKISKEALAKDGMDIPEEFWKTPENVVRDLQNYCLGKFGWTITFDPDLDSYIYFYIKNPTVKALFMILFSSKPKAPPQDKMAKFAQWHNTLNYFWLYRTGQETKINILTNNTPYRDNATLPIIFSMPDGNKEQFIYAAFLSRRTQASASATAITLKASLVVLKTRVNASLNTSSIVSVGSSPSTLSGTNSP